MKAQIRGALMRDNNQTPVPFLTVLCEEESDALRVALRFAQNKNVALSLATAR